MYQGKQELISEQKVYDLKQLATLFLKLGSTGFGGLAVQVALMDAEVVEKRKWLTRETFSDLVGSSNLVPGPNAVEIALQIGYMRAKWLGFIVSGACFILPSVLITLGFAWFYKIYGAAPQIAPFLEGIKPTILIVILISTWKLGKTVIKNWYSAALGIAVLIASVLGVNEMIAIFLGGAFGMLWLSFFEKFKNTNNSQIDQSDKTKFILPKTVILLGLSLCVVLVANPNNFGEISIWKLGLFFLKVGTLLYGGGYVLIAFLQGGLVDNLGWLTQQQLIDAVAVGQITPGPLLSTATFVGYLILGLPGAVVATVAIFLPSFLFSLLLHSVIPQLRRFRWTSIFLSAITISSIALMVAVVLTLSQSVLINWQSWLIALVTFVVGFQWKVNPSFLILGGAVMGWILFNL